MVIPDAPGSYKKFCSLLGRRAITEFNYRYADNQKAHIYVGLQVNPDNNDRQELVAMLSAKGYEVHDFTENEMAKLHIRHMVGGHAPGTLTDEVVYRFEFPDISMSHYRNQGAAFGRVLVGLQVPKKERRSVEQSLKELNYRFCDESQNEAYRFFLA